jgi:hypothetical protein
MATSLRAEDYLGRSLTNGTPGTTDPVTDYVGRVAASTTDYLGRTTTCLPWPGAVAVTVGTTYYVAGGRMYVSVAGTPAAGAATIPGAVGGTVVSGTATFTRYK